MPNPFEDSQEPSLDLQIKIEQDNNNEQKDKGS